MNIIQNHNTSLHSNTDTVASNNKKGILKASQASSHQNSIASIKNARASLQVEPNTYTQIYQ